MNRRQKWRIEKVQTEYTARAQKSHQQSKSNLGKTSEEHIGLVITRFGQHLLVESASGQLFKCTGRQNIALSVAGDQVIFQAISENQGVVTALLDRNNQLEHTHKLIAANVDALWLVVAIEPHYQFELIDRYLIVAENANLPINIVVNKIELAKDLGRIKRDFCMYEQAGYQVYYLSVQQQTHTATLQTLLKRKTHLFLGQSGVGKSSLINLLIPNIELRVSELSDKSKLGKHTTTNTILYHIPSGGNLIDSPGVREFQLDSLSNQEITQGFKEFKPFIKQCKFRDCAHIHEPNCAIKIAVKSGKIHAKRYQSYLNLIG